MTEPPGIPLAEAASRLGLSQDAVRMRVRRGHLVGVRQNGRLHVVFDGSEPERTTERTDRTETEPRSDRTEQLLTQLQGENARLWEALRAEQQASAELRRLLAMNVPALPAGAAEPVARSHTDAATPAEPVKLRRAWWRWWRR